jgi:hypothetical protein
LTVINHRASWLDLVKEALLFVSEKTCRPDRIAIT